jgi:hypothetical protein
MSKRRKKIMVDVKRTVKMDMVLKNARLVEGNIVDEDGIIIDLMEAISKIYGEDVEFKLALSRTTSEEIDIDEIENEE